MSKNKIIDEKTQSLVVEDNNDIIQIEVIYSTTRDDFLHESKILYCNSSIDDFVCELKKRFCVEEKFDAYHKMHFIFIVPYTAEKLVCDIYISKIKVGSINSVFDYMK